MRGAHARNPPGRDFTALRNEGHQQSRVLVVDIVDLVDAEPAQFLAPEILFLAGDGLVAAGGALGSADGSSASGFRHVISPELLFLRGRGYCLGCSRS